MHTPPFKHSLEHTGLQHTGPVQGGLQVQVSGAVHVPPFSQGTAQTADRGEKYHSVMMCKVTGVTPVYQPMVVEMR